MEILTSLHGRRIGLGQDGTLVIDKDGTQKLVPINDNVQATAATLTVTKDAHAGRTIVLDRAAGIAVTLPAPTGSGDKYRFVVKTTFTGAASIKSVASAHIMIGHALMGNNSDNTVVDWPAVASSTYDTIDLFGTANSTGGIEGQVVEIEDIAANTWFVEIRGDAAGTEATPFANTVS